MYHVFISTHKQFIGWNSRYLNEALIWFKILSIFLRDSPSCGCNNISSTLTLWLTSAEQCLFNSAFLHGFTKKNWFSMVIRRFNKTATASWCVENSTITNSNLGRSLNSATILISPNCLKTGWIFHKHWTSWMEKQMHK